MTNVLNTVPCKPEKIYTNYSLIHARYSIQIANDFIVNSTNDVNDYWIDD